MEHQRFPDYWAGMLPKKETQAAQFVENHPGWDGRGVIVGILDTGVDPGAIGLQSTSDGLPKVIDSVDCSGSGDVTMGPKVKVNEDGTVPGIGDRKLRVNPSWVNPSGEYRVGIKRASELYPSPLKDRVDAERKKQWMLRQKNLEMVLQKELSETQSKSIGANADEVADDLKARIALMKNFEKDRNDPGPIYDCLVFHDGERWQVIHCTFSSTAFFYP